MGFRGPKTGQGGRPVASRLGAKTRVSIPIKLVPLISELVEQLELSPFYNPETWDFDVHIMQKETKPPKVKSSKGKGFSGKNKAKKQAKTLDI